MQASAPIDMCVWCASSSDMSLPVLRSLSVLFVLAREDRLPPRIMFFECAETSLSWESILFILAQFMFALKFASANGLLTLVMMGDQRWCKARGVVKPVGSV